LKERGGKKPMDSWERKGGLLDLKLGRKTGDVPLCVRKKGKKK